MAFFRGLVCAALCAGLIAGIVAAAAHQIATVPLILKAETYEHAGAPGAHDHGPAGWEPENGIERTLFTLAADLLTAIGFALLLAAGFALHGGGIGWREGLFWGLAGFVVFALAPGLGLPPEIPGTAAAPLAARQLWWLATTLATGAGLALLAFTRSAPYAAAAVLLIVLPHLYGAPQPAVPAADAAPAALAHRFIVAATVASLVFWTTLGAATGYFYHRFAARPGGR